MSPSTRKSIIIALLLISIGFAGGWFTKSHFTPICPNVFTVKGGVVKDSVHIVEPHKIEGDWHEPNVVKIDAGTNEIISDRTNWEPVYGHDSIPNTKTENPQQYFYDTSSICEVWQKRYYDLLQKYQTETTYTDTTRGKNVSAVVDSKVKENKLLQKTTLFDTLVTKNTFNINSLNKIVGYYGFSGGYQNATRRLYLGANLSLKLKNDNIVGLSAVANDRLQMLYLAEYKHPIRLFKLKK